MFETQIPITHCISCGQEISSGAKYCTSCGKKTAHKIRHEARPVEQHDVQQLQVAELQNRHLPTEVKIIKFDTKEENVFVVNDYIKFKKKDIIFQLDEAFKAFRDTEFNARLHMHQYGFAVIPCRAKDKQLYALTFDLNQLASLFNKLPNEIDFFSSQGFVGVKPDGESHIKINGISFTRTDVEHALDDYSKGVGLQINSAKFGEMTFFVNPTQVNEIRHIVYRILGEDESQYRRRRIDALKRRVRKVGGIFMGKSTA